MKIILRNKTIIKFFKAMKLITQMSSFLSFSNFSLNLLLFSCAFHFNVVKSSNDLESEKYKRQISDYEYDYENRCTIPTSYLDKTASYQCSTKRSQNRPCIVNGGTEVLEYTTATFSCKSGYHLVKNVTRKWICLEKSWSPEIPECDKLCDKLSSSNVDLRCFHNDGVTDCNGLLLPGDKVYPACKPMHIFEGSASNLELICQKNGKWNKKLLPCVPECGRPFMNALPLISKGQEEKFGDAPWNVAVYNDEKILICSGTLITPQLVLTAAHCFYSDAKLPAANYEIVVSKFTRNYSLVDNSYQKTFKVKEIRFSNKGFHGLKDYFTHDIALLILDGKIERTPAVLPACVHWTPKEKSFSLEDVIGKVSGWGENEHENLSEKLMTATVPYIGRDRCLKIVSEDFQPFLPYDKFCAGSKSGSIGLRGDSGLGFLFKEGEFYYVLGVLSVKQGSSSTAVAGFTNVANHIDWIMDVRRDVEKVL